jgi:Flp pilus assembly pilin Flp
MGADTTCIPEEESTVTNLSIRVIAYVTSLVKSREEGQDLIEYAMLGGLIAAGILLVLTLFNGAVQNMIQGVGNCIDFSNSSTCSPGF